jgi:hypothetical protein
MITAPAPAACARRAFSRYLLRDIITDTSSQKRR